MSSIQKTSTGKWAVRYKEDGHHRQKTFRTKVEAQRFCLMTDASPEQRRSSLTVAELFTRYRDEVSARKKGRRWEEIRIDTWLRQPWAQLKLAAFDAGQIERYMAGRDIGPATIRREMTLMSSIFNDAIRKGLATENPVRTAEKPREPEHRERIASEHDIQLLLAASGWDGESVPANSVQMVMAAFLLSCRTGMRSGEMLRIERTWIDGRVIHLPADATKTGSRRDVALGPSAMRILELILAAGHKPAIFGLSDQVRDQLWRRVRDRAGLGPVVDSAGRVISEGLTFHDARASFCTWAASPDPKTGAPRLDVLALARQTGHRNLRMLQRYYRATAEQIADRLE